MPLEPNPERPWTAVARLLRPQGRRGELLSEPLTDLPGVLAAGREVVLAPPGAAIPAPRQAVLSIEDVWSPTGKNAGRVVIKLSGCDTISQAEALGGQDLLIETAGLPALEPDTFFVSDLLGCQLYDGAAFVGTIVDIQFPTSSDGRRLEDAATLLAVQLHRPPDPHSTTASQSAESGSAESGSAESRLAASDSEYEPQQRLTIQSPAASVLEPVLVPFIRAWLDSVDLPGRRIVMHLPLGLLDPSGLT